MKSPPECQTRKCDPQITLKENRSKLTFLNPNRDEITVIKVDGCAIKDNNTLKCDYAIVPCDEIEMYVELKGCDIPHAIKQLESTIKLLSENPKKIKKHCFIVSTRFPKYTTSIQILKDKFRKNFNSTFQVKNIQDECDLSKIKP